MKRFRQVLAIFAIAVPLSVGPAAFGQPPSAGRSARPSADLGTLSQEMADLVLNLAEVMLRDLGGTSEGLHLIADARELGQAVVEFREVTRATPDAFAARQAFLGIDQSWNHLKQELSGRRTTPAIDRAAFRIDAVDQQLRAALGVQAIPPGLFVQPPLDVGQIDPARREAQALNQQAQALVAAMRAELGDHPNRDHVLSDANHLVERSRTFDQFLAQGPPPDQLRTAYASLNDAAQCLYSDLSRQPPPAAVAQAWQQFCQSQQTLTQRLDLPPPPPIEFGQYPMAAPMVPAPELAAARQQVQGLHQQAESLVAAMRAELGDHPNRDHVMQDAQQLFDRTRSFDQFLAQGPPEDQIRLAYAQINDVANCLYNDLSRQPPPSRVVQAWQSFARSQQTVTQSLDLPLPPPPFEFGPGPVGPQVLETRRVSYSLQQRSESLVQTMRTQLGNHPNQQHILQDVQQLSQRTESFTQVLAGNPTPQQIQQAYLPVQEVATCLQGDLTRHPAPGPVMEQWNTFMQAQYLIHQALELPPPPPAASINLFPGAGAPSPILGMADELVGRIEAFLAAFTPTAHVVPEGDRFLADAQRLHQAALIFREECQRGVDPNRLAYRFQEVDVSWNRLARRIQRVSRGRIGPNIATALQIGETCARIHQVLGMPGYPPVLQGMAVPFGGR